jgi:hypothetical protein
MKPLAYGIPKSLTLNATSAVKGFFNFQILQNTLALYLFSMIEYEAVASICIKDFFRAIPDDLLYLYFRVAYAVSVEVH